MPFSSTAALNRPRNQKQLIRSPSHSLVGVGAALSVTQHPLHGGSRLLTVCKLQRFLAHCLQFIHPRPGQTGQLHYHCGYRPHTHMCVYRLYVCMCLHMYADAQHIPALLRVASWGDVQLEWTFVHPKMAQHDKPAGGLFLTIMAITLRAQHMLGPGAMSGLTVPHCISR